MVLHCATLLGLQVWHSVESERRREGGDCRTYTVINSSYLQVVSTLPWILCAVNVVSDYQTAMVVIFDLTHLVQH